ncbi:50S ribosomal protein L11 [bacterium (Candidatus Howlettbacteria) CG_4_10_14_0_8_um_filter_40_9]|nr:MAG: 50S ribosomal protein L11 [bacterium (Candidatus Howlettbacteria) CG_4_10_14_0_8_um_filter_40_9]
MAKKIKTKLKLQVRAGQANPAPPVGPALGQHGLNIMDFCNSFNEQTKEKQGAVLPVVITVYEDRTFDFIIKTSPAAELIKKALGASKGSGVPNKEKLPKKLSKAQLREIAETKMADLNANDIGQAEKMIAGTARSMGVEIEK